MSLILGDFDTPVKNFQPRHKPSEDHNRRSEIGVCGSEGSKAASYGNGFATEGSTMAFVYHGI